MFFKNKGDSTVDVISNIFMVIILSLFTIICVFPIYYVFIYSISDPVLAQTGITFLPKGFSLEAYKAVFTLDSIFHSFLISVARTFIGPIVTVATCGFFAYLMTQEKMPFRKVIYRTVIITMYISGGLIPTYIWMKKIGLLDNFLVYILPTALSAYNVILIKTFMESIPKSLEESAQLDGAGHFTIFTKIIAPVSIPILATIAVFSAVGQWSSWFDNMLYINNSNLNTIQYVLYQYLNEAQALATQIQDTLNQGGTISNNQSAVTPESIKMAITMVVVIPILFVYPYMQRYFIKGIMIGSVKG